MYKQLTAWFTTVILVLGSAAALADRKGHGDYRHWQPPGHRVLQVHKHSRNEYSGHLGAVLLGSAISYSLFHHHNGAVCHDSHGYRDTRGYRNRYGSRNRIVGCQRIERYADGSERRVRVPLSQCR